MGHLKIPMGQVTVIINSYSSSSSSSSSSIPDSVTVEEYELFHKSLVLRIKKGDCADYLLTI